MGLLSMIPAQQLKYIAKAMTVNAQTLVDRFGLADKTAIVTGGATGIGRETARLLSAAGSRVAIADLDYEGAREVATGLQQEGQAAIPLACDVRCEESVQAMIRQVIEHFEHIDILVNNAGVFPGGRFPHHLRGALGQCAGGKP